MFCTQLAVKCPSEDPTQMICISVVRVKSREHMNNMKWYVDSANGFVINKMKHHKATAISFTVWKYQMLRVHFDYVLSSKLTW